MQTTALPATDRENKIIVAQSLLFCLASPSSTSSSSDELDLNVAPNLSSFGFSDCSRAAASQPVSQSASQLAGERLSIFSCISELLTLRELQGERLNLFASRASHAVAPDDEGDAEDEIFIFVERPPLLNSSHLKLEIDFSLKCFGLVVTGLKTAQALQGKSFYLLCIK